MTATGAPRPGGRAVGLAVKGILVALGALFTITLRAFPEAYAQNVGPFAAFISTPVVGFITVGALLLLLLTTLTAIGSRDLTLAALVAAVGSIVFSALYAVLLVQPGQYCVRSTLGIITGAPECTPDYTPQIFGFAGQFASVFLLAIVGLSPLAFIRRVRQEAGEATMNIQVQVPPPTVVVQPGPGSAPPAPPRPAAPAYRPPQHPPAPVRTAIPPVVRAPVPPPPPPELHPMNSYLVSGASPKAAYDLFRKAVAKGAPGLCVSRTHPDEARRSYGLPAQVRLHWLSKTGDAGTLNPANMEQMFATLSEFLTSQKGAVILFDGVEYLATEREFTRVLKFMNTLQDAVAVNKAILLVPVNPAALGEREAGLLSRDMKTVKS